MAEPSTLAWKIALQLLNIKEVEEEEEEEEETFEPVNEAHSLKLSNENIVKNTNELFLVETLHQYIASSLKIATISEIYIINFDRENRISLV